MLHILGALKNLPANVGDAHPIPGLGRFSWRRKWQPTPVFLPGKFHGQKPGGLQSMGVQRVGHKEHTHTGGPVINVEPCTKITGVKPCTKATDAEPYIYQGHLRN